jgi:hypothetical protein
MKSKDQQLLEEAYENVKNTNLAKVARTASREELDRLKKDAEEEITKGRRRYNPGLLDFSKGWVWDIHNQKARSAGSRDQYSESVTYITVYRNKPGKDGYYPSGPMRDYTTYLIDANGEIYWMGETTLNGRLTPEAIEQFTE